MSKECKQPLEDRKDKEMDPPLPLPQSLQEGHSPSRETYVRHDMTSGTVRLMSV